MVKQYEQIVLFPCEIENVINKNDVKSQVIVLKRWYFWMEWSYLAVRASQDWDIITFGTVEHLLKVFFHGYSKKIIAVLNA